MLATNDFGGYSNGQLPHGYEQSGERPKLFSMDQHAGYGYHTGPMMGATTPNGTPHHAVTPQHQYQQHAQYDHEPLMMSSQSAPHYYQPMPGAQLLHVATDYASTPMQSNTPSSTRSNVSGAKRSREELNMKEKKRMFKLNDRINQLKQLLDDAGVQCKKNKQSVLDNTFHYVSMLRSNLLIAKQKADRAEKQASQLAAQGSKKSDPTTDVLKQCFLQSSMARAVVTCNMEPVAFNSAFLAQCGAHEDSVAANIRPFLCDDDAKLDEILQTVLSSHKSISASVRARTSSGSISVLLLAAIVSLGNEPDYIEFSLLPSGGSKSDRVGATI